MSNGFTDAELATVGSTAGQILRSVQNLCEDHVGRQKVAALAKEDENVRLALAALDATGDVRAVHILQLGISVLTG